ncbi:MAG TPA: sigma-70 family RNA polymerase sigma factor [Candidatus Kapabacteria bacterium]|nr:sigma-70 family RNA polymerase sigma factor [Candidatus Kapabacteria bacterium]
MSTKQRRVEELLNQVRTGDERAFARLVHELEPFVRSASMKVCRDRATADENAQDTFVSMLRSLEQFSGASSFTTWLYTVIVNNCRMKRRRSKLAQASVPLDVLTTERPNGSAADSSAMEGPEAHMLSEELRRVLGSAIERLPEDYRPVFVLRQLDRLSTKETAEELGLSEAAVKSRLHRARALVRREVESYFVEPAD